MGNCLLLRRANLASCIRAPVGEQNITALQEIEKMDEKYAENKGGVKRIRLVITKQQLQRLLAKEVSIDEVLSGFNGGAFVGFDSLANQRPKLECIPEGDE